MSDENEEPTESDKNDEPKETDENDEPTLPDRPVVVLLGKSGAGKTTLVNRCADATLPTGSGNESVTQSAAICRTIDGKFYMIDTPGLEDGADAVGHFEQQMAALESIAVSQIIIVEEIARVGVLANKIDATLKIFGRA